MAKDREPVWLAFTAAALAWYLVIPLLLLFLSWHQRWNANASDAVGSQRENRAIVWLPLISPIVRKTSLPHHQRLFYFYFIFSNILF